MTDHAHPVDAAAVARARDRIPPRPDAERVTSVLTLIADPTRMRLLFALDAADELCVGDLALALGATEDAVGYGLRMLRTAGLVTRRKDGRMVFYRLAQGFPEPLRQHCLLRLADLSSDQSPDA
ncbi:MAG: ArsR/SmtB family transcription factor [Marmoricola sp.]